jgi:hypothetical protein
MDKTRFRDLFRPIIIFFILIDALCFSCAKWLDAKEIDHEVLMLGNIVLFLTTIVACFIHIRALKNNNPYAFVRAVTVASFLKLIVIAVSVAVYFSVAETKSIYAVAAAMVLYIVYTIFEVRGAMKLNRKSNVQN